MSTDYISLCADHSERIAALEAQRETEKAAILEIYEKLDRLKVRHESNWARIVRLEATQQQQQQSEPIDEKENARRFRACMAAIDAATPEQIRAATPEATQEDPQTLHSVAPPTTEWLPSTALLHGGSQPAPSAAPAPAGGLVEQVAEHIVESMVISDHEAACAAILSVAEWLDTRGQHGCSLWLREEVQRHG